jgi:hypothetical protein
VSPRPPYLVVLASLVGALEAGNEEEAASYGEALSRLVETKPYLTGEALKEALALQAKAEALATARLAQVGRELELGSAATRAARAYGDQR